MQETNDLDFNSNPQYEQERNLDSTGNNFVYKHGQVLGEVGSKNSYIKNFPTDVNVPWRQGNGEPRQ